MEDEDWVSDEQRQKALADDSCWRLQWYPDTPVGFHVLYAADLDVLLSDATSADIMQGGDTASADGGNQTLTTEEKIARALEAKAEEVGEAALDELSRMHEHAFAFRAAAEFIRSGDWRQYLEGETE